MRDLKNIIKHTYPLKLLYVEDDESARESATFLLEDFFESIVMAVDGQDGLEKLSSNEIDLIITDIDMPRLNGLDMIEEIRKEDKDISIIVLSAHMKTEYFLQSIKLNITGYLLKPLDLDSLLDVFNNVIASFVLKEEVLKNMKLKDRMEQALIGNKDGLWDWNLITNKVHFSPRYKEILGYADDEFQDELSSWENRVHSDDLALTKSDMQDNIDGKTNYFENVHRLKHKNGYWIWILTRGKTLYNEDGKAIRMIGTHTDITDTKEMEIKYNEQNKLIAQHEKYLQSIIDSTHDPLMVIKEDYSVDLMNSVLKNSLKYLNIADENNPKCYEVSHHRSTPCDSIEHPCPLRDVLDTKKSTTVLHEHYNLDGEKSYIELAATPLFDENKKCIGIIESSRDITSHVEIQKKLSQQKNMLQHQAHHDTLTGLANRVLFDDRLYQAILRANRSKSKLALFFIDLDKFKYINDSYGHKAGDKVLKDVSKLMKQEIRKEDTIARFGGDEFTIIMEDIHNPQEAMILAQKILRVLELPIDFSDDTLSLSASIGIAVYPDNTVDADLLLKYADIAMYRAKEGDKRILYYDKEKDNQ